MYALLFNDNCYYLLKNLLNIIYVPVSNRYSIYIRDYEILFSYEYYIMQNFDFPCKYEKKKTKILLSKCIQKIQRYNITSLKSLFVLSRYFYRLLRYERSKCSLYLRRREDYE